MKIKYPVAIPIAAMSSLGKSLTRRTKARIVLAFRRRTSTMEKNVFEKTLFAKGLWLMP
jgi:hypothetical protein